MMRFTLGTPDRVVEITACRFLFLCLSSLRMAFWSTALSAIRFMFHLWAYVSPMESIVSQYGDQKTFCDGENPHSSDGIPCRTRAFFMRSKSLIWPALVAPSVAKTLLSVFSLEAQNFYFVRPNMFL
jgi:hypothetical protein